MRAGYARGSGRTIVLISPYLSLDRFPAVAIHYDHIDRCCDDDDPSQQDVNYG